jgi:hypothetical protein
MDTYPDGVPVYFYVTRRPTGLVRFSACARCTIAREMARYYSSPRKHRNCRPPPPAGYMKVTDYARRIGVDRKTILNNIEKYDTTIHNGVIYIKVDNDNKQ